jgi:hypothetical protein
MVISLLSAFGAGCGSGVTGDCSGGYLDGNTCVSTQPTVHWSDARASTAAMRFTYAPMVAGKLTDAHCRIVGRFAGNEATSVCSAMFVAPNATPERTRLAFSLSGIGAVNPDCSIAWRTSPFCAGRNRAMTSADSG